MSAASLIGGFAAPSHDAARAFRGALDAMARPGRIVTLAGAAPPPPMSPAAGALLLTLCDPETPLWLAPGFAGLGAWATFHTGAPVTANRGTAALAVGRWPDIAPLADFAVGTPDYPDRSATLIVELDRLEPMGARLTGPGIDGSARLSLSDLAPDLVTERARVSAFPLGLDFFFTAGDRVAGLPRTTRIDAPCT